MKLRRGMIKVAKWKGEGDKYYPGLHGDHLGIIQSTGDDSLDWNITHLKTGYCVVSGYNIPSFKVGRELLVSLETADGVDWTFVNPKDVSKETRETAKKITKSILGF